MPAIGALLPMAAAGGLLAASTVLLLRSDDPAGTSKYGVCADDADVFAWLREGASGRGRCLGSGHDIC